MEGRAEVLAPRRHTHSPTLQKLAVQKSFAQIHLFMILEIDPPGKTLCGHYTYTYSECLRNQYIYIFIHMHTYLYIY